MRLPAGGYTPRPDTATFEISGCERLARRMAYLKSLLVGIVVALATSAVWILVVFVLPLAIPALVSRLPGPDGGASMATAYIDSGSILAVALVGLVAGFYWQFRRIRKSRPQG